MMERPWRNILLLLALLQVTQPTAAFSVYRRSASFHGSSLQSTKSRPSEVDVTDTQTDQWLKESLEHEDHLVVVVGPKNVLVYDTSLRDGTQGEDVAATCDDKLKITRRLTSFGVDYIEAGWPGSNPKDAEFFERAKTELASEERAKLVAFGSTRRKRVQAKDDAQVQALLESQAPTVCLVAKSHAWQVEEILKATREENLEMIRDTVSFLVQQGRRVFVDLEHFFDGYKSDPEYSLKCAEVAADAGASCLVLCDTNGGSMPWDVQTICNSVVTHFGGLKTIGIHTHNDCGMATANSLAGAQAGVGLIQGTINGIGERTGNADLCSIVPTLSLHMKSNMTCGNNLAELTKLSRFVDEQLNRSPNNAAPYVGASAFAHKGGLHVAAMERSPLSYQHIQPELVGNEKRVLVSELSGRVNILGKIEEVGMQWGDEITNERATAILNRVKALENKGYSFEGADASVHLMILHATKGYCPPFHVLDYAANVHDSNMDSASRVLSWNAKREEADGSKQQGATSRATIKVRTVNVSALDLYSEIRKFTSLKITTHCRFSLTTFAHRFITSQQDPDSDVVFEERLEVADGTGPVDALSIALMKALTPAHPYLRSVELVDYKVRILDPTSATEAATRVMIEFRDTSSDKTWTTVSVDRNVISASLNALTDGLEYALIEHASMCMLCDDDGTYMH